MRISSTQQRGRDVKVLVFTTQYYLCSGAERLAIELAVDLNKIGIHADVLSLYDESVTGVSEKTRELQEAGVPNVLFLGLPVNPSVTAVMRGIAKLRQLIKRHNYDVVETSQLSPSVIASWATFGTGCHHLCGIHAVFQHGLRESRQMKIWRLTARIVRRTRYYAISKYVAEAWVRYTNVGRNNIRVIYNSINDGAFVAQSERESLEQELALPAGARIVLFVGRLDQYKGVDTALDALGPILLQENLVLLYVGHAEISDPASRMMLDAVIEKAHKEEWESRVRFLGRREDVFAIMASSNILVHPSRTEGFGLVLAEAMAIGLPIIASNVDGIPEVLEGTDSQIIPSDDPEALRQATIRVLDWSIFERTAAVNKGRFRVNAFRSDLRTSKMLNYMSDIARERV